MTTTRTEDHQAEAKRAVAAVTAEGLRLSRARQGVPFWEITEPAPGTFRVVTTCQRPPSKRGRLAGNRKPTLTSLGQGRRQPSTELRYRQAPKFALRGA